MPLARSFWLLLVLSSLCFPATVFVPDDYPTIQGAIASDATSNGDTIIVRPGTYFENLDFLGKAIALRSENGPALTVIDGGHPTNPMWACVVGFQNSEGPDSIIDGFTLTNGRGFEPDSLALGAGIYCWMSTPTIINNIITGNRAVSTYPSGSGGGIGVWGYTGPIIMNNIIRDNVSASEGGGIYLSGGDGSIIKGNLICGNSSFLEGGGVYFNWSGSTVTFVNNVVLRNTADKYYGGGVSLIYTNLTVSNSTILLNSAKRGGGGIIQSSGGYLTITNSILRGNEPDQVYQQYPDVTYSNIEGGYPGTGNIDAAPLFVDALNDDFHLTWQSPCRDAGNNAGVNSSFDWEGDPRIAGSRVDMGADEFSFHLYHSGAVVPGGNVEIKVVGGPGMTPVRIGVGSGVLDPPVPTPYGDFYLCRPIQYLANLGGIPPKGVLVVPATIPGFLSPGDAKPLQALAGALGGPYTRLTNLEVLRVE